MLFRAPGLLPCTCRHRGFQASALDFGADWLLKGDEVVNLLIDKKVFTERIRQVHYGACFPPKKEP